MGPKQAEKNKMPGMGYVRARLDQRQSHAGFTNTYVAWDFCMFSKVFILTWTKKCSSLY